MRSRRNNMALRWVGCFVNVVNKWAELDKLVTIKNKTKLKSYKTRPEAIKTTNYLIWKHAIN